MKNATGQELEPGTWYAFGGNVEWRYTGSKRITYSARVDKGQPHKASGPASRDAINAALYYGKPSKGYASFIGGTIPDSIPGTMY